MASGQASSVAKQDLDVAARRAKRQGIRSGDREAMRVAARQWGALSRTQASRAGLSRDQIVYRLRTGQWRQAAQGVYVVAGTPSRWEQKAMIATLAGPPHGGFAPHGGRPVRPG